MVLKTAAMDPLDYRRYIFYTFLALLSTLLTLSLVAVARCCANRAAANVDKVGTEQYSTVQYISFSAGCSDTRGKLVSGMQCHAGKSCRRYVATRWQILLAVCSDTLETQIGSRHMQCFGSGSCI